MSKSKGKGKDEEGERTMKYVAPVNVPSEAIRLFNRFNIPYEIISRGENKGLPRIKKPGQRGFLAILDAERALDDIGYRGLCDHANVFIDADGKPVVTFSPYNVMAKIIEAGEKQGKSEMAAADALREMGISLMERKTEGAFSIDGPHGRFQVDIVDISIYGICTQTVVVREA